MPTAPRAITVTTPTTMRATHGAASQMPVAPAIWPMFFSLKGRLDGGFRG